MRYYGLPASVCALVVLIGLASTGCDVNSSNKTFPPITAPSGAGATITGFLSPSPGTPSTSTFVPGATVQIDGTDVSTIVGSDLTFTLTNVPTTFGTQLVLVFNSGGITARFNIGFVSFGDRVVLVFARSLDGTLALTRVDRRNADGTDLTGRIDSISFTDRSFIVLGQTILTDPSTVFIRSDGTAGSFFDLFVGLVVRAFSVRAPGGFGAVIAKTVLLEDTGAGAVVIIQGTILNLTGDALSFSFVVRGQLVRGGSNTTFDNNRTFGGLREGDTVEVTGLQRNGFIQATRIRLAPILR
jgi:hypothetical protein